MEQSDVGLEAVERIFQTLQVDEMTQSDTQPLWIPNSTMEEE